MIYGKLIGDWLTRWKAFFPLLLRSFWGRAGPTNVVFCLHGADWQLMLCSAFMELIGGWLWPRGLLHLLGELWLLADAIYSFSNALPFFMYSWVSDLCNFPSVVSWIISRQTCMWIIKCQYQWMWSYLEIWSFHIEPNLNGHTGLGGHWLQLLMSL